MRIWRTMNKLIELSIKKYFELRRFRIKGWVRSQVDTQEFIIQELISEALATAFGKEHGFVHIDTIDKYQELVPIRTHAELLPYIQDMMAGKKDILWPGAVTMFSKSSGTTSSISKYLPVSRESLQENNYKAGRDLYAIISMIYPELNIFSNEGSVLGITGSFEKRDDNMKVGDVSAIIASELPSMFQERRKPSLGVALMKDWEEKIDAIITECVPLNITHLSGVPTWFIPLFNELQKRHPYQTLRDIWPNLQLFIHGAVSFKPYEERFHKLLPFEDMKYIEVYNASEGFFAIQDDEHKKGEMLLLTDHGVFYEFIDFHEYQQGSRKAIWLNAVTLHTPYALIISTNAGLFRYDIGDVIEFTSRNPMRIRIVGRTKTCLNLCGEELMEGNTDMAIQQLSEELGMSIDHYTVTAQASVGDHVGHHQWIIESEDTIDVASFALALDMKLRALNSDYDAKRTGNLALGPLEIHVVAKGTFMRWLASKGKLGGQHKVPKLFADRSIYEEILQSST